jgi:hypothetical protein
MTGQFAKAIEPGFYECESCKELCVYEGRGRARRPVLCEGCRSKEFHETIKLCDTCYGSRTGKTEVDWTGEQYFPCSCKNLGEASKSAGHAGSGGSPPGGE